MRAETRIRTAAKEYYGAFVDYARIVLNIPVSMNVPRANYHPGKGWELDGKFYPMTSTQLVEFLEGQRDYWRKLRRDAVIEGTTHSK